MRPFHKLRGDAKLKYPLALIFLDTETTTIKEDEEEHVPRLKVGYAEFILINDELEIITTDNVVFNDPSSLWDWVLNHLSDHKKINMYAHNWGFDFPVLNGFNTLEFMGFELKAIVDQSPPVILRYKHKYGELNIIDSMNYFQQPLETIGESIGVKKMCVNFDTVSDNELLLYCKQDVKIVRQAIINLMRYLKENNLSKLTPTVSSIAFNTFITRFKTHEINIDGDPERLAITRKSYFGGRTECFRIGKYKGIYRLIDVNSQYPFVMRYNYFPTKTVGVHRNLAVNDLHSIVNRYCITGIFSINTTIPAFPYKIDGRTCFPIGRFRVFLSTPEIHYALEKNLIQSVELVVIHEKARIFKKYIDYMYSQRIKYRKEGNDSYAEFSKKLMNTLYGKFGQQLHKWEESKRQARGYPGKWVEIDIDKRQRLSFMEIGGKVYESIFETESRDSYPAIAAHVTAYGRILIQRMIDQIGREHCYYCDTDSLLIDDEGFQKVKDKIDPYTLGGWSLDGEYNSIEIRCPKDYSFGEKERIKGLRKNHTVLHEGLYRMIQFKNLKALIRDNHTHAPIIKHIEKRFERVYRKGVVRSNGVVDPFEIDE